MSITHFTTLPADPLGGLFINTMENANHKQPHPRPCFETTTVAAVAAAAMRGPLLRLETTTVADQTHQVAALDVARVESHCVIKLYICTLQITGYLDFRMLK